MRLTPRNRTHPAFDQISTICRALFSVEPSHARLRSPDIEMFDLDGDSSTHGIYVSTKVDTHQQQQESVRGGAVSEGGVSAAWMRLPSLQGRTCSVPALRHRPAILRKARCCC